MEVTKTSELAESETPLYQPAHACARYGVVKTRKNKSRPGIKVSCLLTSKTAILVRLR
jgi:hypothetical protein